MMYAKLVLLLLLSLAGLPSLAVQPVDVHCEVARNLSGDFIKLRWKQISSLSTILNYRIIWNCSDSDHYRMFTPPHSPCDSDNTCQYDFKTENCFEMCSYTITPITYCLHLSSSQEYTCYIDNNEPKEAVKVNGVKRILNDGVSIEVTFQRQSSHTFCDNTITSAAIKVDTNENIPAVLLDNRTQIKAVDNKEFIYSTTFEVDDVLRWKPFSFSLSVSNTVGDSPFADYFYVKGATNGDLPMHNYTYMVHSDETSVTVQWELSSLPVTLLQSRFITGYTYHLYTPNGIEMVEDSTNSSHVFHNLEPSNIYYVTSKIITSDRNSWGPEMILKNITTKGPHRTAVNKEFYYLTTICVLSVVVILMITGIILYSVKRKYQKKTFEKTGQDLYAYDNHNMSELSSNPDTILQEPKSVVESVAAANSTKDSGNVVTPGAYVRILPVPLISPGQQQHQQQQQQEQQQQQQQNHGTSFNVNDMESGTAAVHNETDNMAGFTEHVGVTTSAGISVVMGEYTDFPPESSEQVGALNCASVVSGEYFDTPPASMEHVGVPNGADISVVTGEYVDTPPASMEHVGATNDTTLSVITGKYMGISPVSTEHDGATSNADISVSMGEYMEMPLVTTGHSGASNNNSVSVITGEYVQIPIGSTEHFGATNSPIVTGEYMVIPPDNMPPNFMVVSKV